MPEWIGDPPFSSDWSEHMRSLLGKNVKVVLDYGKDDKETWIYGTLLSFNEGGEVAIRHEDGFVSWAWPALRADEKSDDWFYAEVKRAEAKRAESPDQARPYYAEGFTD